MFSASLSESILGQTALPEEHAPLPTPRTSLSLRRLSQKKKASRDTSLIPPPLQMQLNTTRTIQKQMTPPSTPNSPQTLPELADSAQPALFHKYLRAFHAFHPSSTLVSMGEEASSITVPINEGDLILVHSIHANGWADGTVLTSGARGWLPTNYCEQYDHPYLRNLLNGMTQFWDLLGASEDSNLSVFVRQDYIRGIIAGVRYLLETADCLHRTSDVVQCHIGIRRMRKSLLSDLSMMVRLAKELQEALGQAYAPEVTPSLLDSLIFKAFKVVTRAVRFVDIWTQETVRKEDTTAIEYTKELPTPPIESVTTDGQFERTMLRPVSCSIISPATPTFDMMGSSLILDSASSPFRRASEGDVQSTNEQKKCSRDHGFQVTTLTSVQSHSAKAAAPFFLSSPPSWANWHRRGYLASEELKSAHDTFIGTLGAFVGRHMQLTYPSELAAATKQAVAACGSLIEVVDQLREHDKHRSDSVQKSKKSLQEGLDKLVFATEQVFNFWESNETARVLPDQGDLLVDAACRCVRDASTLVAKTKLIIDRTGDVEVNASVVAVPETIEEETVSVVDAAERGTDGRSSPHARLGAQSRESSEVKSLSKELPSPPARHRQLDTPSTGTRPAPVSPTSSVSPASPKRMSRIPRLDVTLSPASTKSLPPLPHTATHQSLQNAEQAEQQPHFVLAAEPAASAPARKDSVGMCVSDIADTCNSSTGDSEVSATSASTRATTPDQTKVANNTTAATLNSSGSISSIRSVVSESSSAAEAQILHKTYAHELVLNHQGQVTGGTLNALVERIAECDVKQDHDTVVAFMICFRKFVTPRDFAQALLHRFDYSVDNKINGFSICRRVYQIFKKWTETYWDIELDRAALGEIRFFAIHRLPLLSSYEAGILLGLVGRLSTGYTEGTLVVPFVPFVSNVRPSAELYGVDDVLQAKLLSKRDLIALRNACNGGKSCSIMDFHCTEVARQITLISNSKFREITQQELLSLVEDGQNGQHMSKLAEIDNSIVYLVVESVLNIEVTKKRAAMIKQWIKIASFCEKLSNYEGILMITAGLKKAAIMRLKVTWSYVAEKHRSRMNELCELVEQGPSNWKNMRKRLDESAAPCQPFLGMYQTDMQFLAQGNAKTRILPGSSADPADAISVVNFDRYMRIARLICQVQRFQVPYQKTQPVEELQAWLKMQYQRMQDLYKDDVVSFHKLFEMSYACEPRVEPPKAPETTQGERDGSTAGDSRPTTGKDRLENRGLSLDRLSNVFGLHGVALGRQDLVASSQ